nr:DUF6427 family protein [Allomuricauda sp.]
MISTFFGKTKPINYIVLSVFLFLFYCLFIFLYLHENGGAISIGLEVLSLGVLLLMIFVINRTVKTEKVTDFSSFAMLFFVLLLVAFSDVLLDKNAIFMSFFLLLAIWRLLAIKSIKNVKHKLFDASFLICLASLFYSWALLFLILVFIVINVYERKTVKNWMVPFLALLSVFVLVFAVTRLFGWPDFFLGHYNFSLGFLDKEFLAQSEIPKIVIYISIIGIVSSLIFLKVRRKGGGKLVPLRILFLSFILGVAISFLTGTVTTAILITFFPAAVFITNYLETIKKPRLRELVVVLCIIFPLLLFVLGLNP